MSTITHRADVAALLERLDEIEMQQRRVHAAWREGWRAGHRAGLEEGRALEGAEREEAWRRNAGMILVRLNPDGPEARESARRRIAAAEAGCRRDAWDQWRGFIQRAWETPPHLRTEQQRAAVALSRSWARAGAA